MTDHSSPPLPRHSAVIEFASAENELLVGGRPLRQLAEQIGHTPF